MFPNCSAVTTAKGEYLSAKVTKKGRAAAEILAELLPKEMDSIYWPKNMYWRKPSERFVRPVRWLVAMLDGEVIPLEFDGIRAGNQSRGHRILADGAVAIPRAGRPMYTEALEQAKVLGREQREKADSEDSRRRDSHHSRARAGAKTKPLLDTVVNLTEWPSVILGSFDPEFLELPEEVLVTVMRDHQKYFAVEDARGRLAATFSGGAEHGRGFREASSGMATSACCAPASTMRAFSGRPTRSIRCGSGPRG